jgi:hypothetical protein
MASKFAFSPSTITRSLVMITIILLIINIIAIHSLFFANNSFPFASVFYFDRRWNLPFLFTMCMLVFCLYLVYRIASRKRDEAPELEFWKILGFLFLFFAVDKSFNLHYKFKMMTFGTVASYNETSPSHYIWVLPYLLIAGFLVLRLRKRSVHLEPLLNRQLIFAAIVFGSGAIIMEFAGTFYGVVVKGADVYILGIKTLEELLQMIGLIMFTNALGNYYHQLKSTRSAIG